MDISLEKFDKSNSELLNFVKNTLKTQIEPLYGDQSLALEKVINMNDRKCFILFTDNKPLGLLIFKENLSSEFSQYGVYDSLEIKTLVLNSPNENSGRGYGTVLLNKAIEYSCSKSLKSIHVTICEERHDSCRFFEKKGFTRIIQLPRIYHGGRKNEILYQKNLS